MVSHVPCPPNAYSRAGKAYAMALTPIAIKRSGFDGARLSVACTSSFELMLSSTARRLTGATAESPKDLNRYRWMAFTFPPSTVSRSVLASSPALRAKRTLHRRPSRQIGRMRPDHDPLAVHQVIHTRHHLHELILRAVAFHTRMRSLGVLLQAEVRVRIDLSDGVADVHLGHPTFGILEMREPGIGQLASLLMVVDIAFAGQSQLDMELSCFL